MTCFAEHNGNKNFITAQCMNDTLKKLKYNVFRPLLTDCNISSFEQ